jgi:DNA-binding MarR family transcriptional regulator
MTLSEKLGNESAAYIIARRFLQVFGALKGLLLTTTVADIAADLHANQLTALHFVFYEPGITQTALAARLNVTTTAVSKSVREMVEQGLIERRTDPNDARSMKLYLAPKGQHIVEEIIEASIQVLVDLLSTLESDEQQALVENLERAITAKHISLDIGTLNYWN